MNILRIVAFLGTVVSYVAAVAVLVTAIKTKRMSGNNKRLSTYIKNLAFLLMKNAGENPCEMAETFEMAEFSQDCDYICKRGGII